MTLTWDFWVILQTNVFLKDIVIAFDFVKKKKNLYGILLPNTESGGPLVAFLLSSPNSLLDLRHVLYFGRKQRETSCLHGVGHSRTTFPPSLSMGQKLLVI